MSNKAAWVQIPAGELVVAEAQTYSPGPHEVLVKNEARIQKFAFLPIPYPNILGISAAGTVLSIGSSITKFQPGDHILISRRGAASGDSRFGTFQTHLLAVEDTSIKLPHSINLVDAAATIANVGTVVSALSISLKLDRPSLSSPVVPTANKSKKVLIYGGSSVVAGFAIKYAADGGYSVVTTSSPANKAYVESRGPALILDHTQPAADLAAAIKANGPYVALFDTIGAPAVSELFAKVLDRDQVYYTTLPPRGPEIPLPDGAKRVFASYIDALDESGNEELAAWFRDVYVPQGLVNGAVIPPRTEVKQGGVEGIQAVLDELLRGVSAKKLVTSL